MTDTTDPVSRWVGVGQSAAADAFDAGRAAAADALRGHDPKLVLLFCSDSYDLPRLLAGVREAAPETPLIGRSTAGEISPAGASTSSVVVTAFGGEGFSVRTAAAAGASTRLREAGEEVAAALLADVDEPHRVAVLLSDALGGDQQEVIRGAYSTLGAAVPLVGACAGDDFKMAGTHQFFGDDVCRDTLVGALLVSDAPLGIGVRHGWTR